MREVRSIIDRWVTGFDAVGGTSEVGCDYEDGGRANTTRRKSMSYPDGRQIDFGFGSNGGVNDRLSRVASLNVNGETNDLVRYCHLGGTTTVQVNYPQPAADLSYLCPDPGDPYGDAGDPYTGLDRFGQSIDMPWRTGAPTPVTLDRFQWGFDRIGNRNWKTNLVAEANAPMLPQDEKYNYDGLSQIEQFARGRLNLNHTAISAIPVAQENFAFDATGNWNRHKTAADGSTTQDQSRVNNRANQITQIDGSSDAIAHDLVGNATKMPPGADGDWDKHFRLKWDGWNRLVEVRDQDGVLVAHYGYDALTRRITRTVGGATTHSYYNHQWRPVEERIGSSSDATAQYLWGARNRDDLVRRDRDSSGNGSLDEILYVTHDYFHPTAILAASDASVMERYAYSAFGIRRIMADDFSSRAASEFDWEFAFQGQFEDGETGYLNYGYRFYSPRVGRWLAMDPLEPNGSVDLANNFDEWNLYCFVRNSSPNDLDKLGLFSDSPNGRIRQRLIRRFNRWHAKNNTSQGRAWLDLIPKCPSEIDICPLTKMPFDCDSQIWNPLSGPGLHVGAKWCMRSVSYYGHGQQCCYFEDGKIATGHPAGGTPDISVGDWKKGIAIPHWYHDVVPYELAEDLDEHFGLKYGRDDDSFLGKYYEVRPPSTGGGVC